MAYVTSADGKPVTVAMFSKPSNYRHPTYWFTMTTPFAYITATLNLDKQPHNMKRGSPLDLTYGVAVFDGKQDVLAIDKVCNQWLELIKETKQEDK